MKQTAIEWLIEQYIEKLTLTPAMVEQAKAMEKEQIRKAYLADAYNSQYGFEQYYNETYEQDKQG
jgi:hypothetical protein